MQGNYLGQRLIHPHYISNALLCLPLPAVLLLSTALDLTSSIVLGSLPTFFLLQAYSGKGSRNAGTFLVWTLVASRSRSLLYRDRD